MPNETLIHLELESAYGCLLISSPEFPLLQLCIENRAELEARVLPVLKKMIESQYGFPVQLRIIEPFDTWVAGTATVPPPHVIAQRSA